MSLAVVFTEDYDPVPAALDQARRIAKNVPGVSVAEVHDELVSISDIARRCRVAAEAARLWSAGRRRAGLRPFPPARQVVGAGPSKTTTLYAWREVVDWVREVVEIDPDDGVRYLDDLQLSEANAEIAMMRVSPWNQVVAEERTTPNTVLAERAVAVGLGGVGHTIGQMWAGAFYTRDVQVAGVMSESAQTAHSSFFETRRAR